MAKQLFGTDGIRGKANQYPITPEIALRVGRSVARTLCTDQSRVNKVIIGKDTRISGTMLESAISSSLISEGVEVTIAGVTSTPAIARLTGEMDYTAGIMLTASHNPYQDNGIKIFGPDGFKLSDEQELASESIILADTLHEPEAPLGGVTTDTSLSEQYITFAKNAVSGRSFSGLKVVLDCANGSAHKIAPRIFQELGAEVIALSTSPDGKNINQGCGALHPDQAASAVLEHKAHIGICFDGDADRVIFCDEKGKVIDGDSILCLCAKALHAQGKLKNNTLVATVMSNLGLRDSLTKDGIKLETTGVGDKLVLERMREKGYNLGGENSGHIIYSDYATTGDGVMSALMILALMQDRAIPFSELANCMDIYPQVLLALEVSEKPPITEVPALAEAIAAAENAFADKGRVLVRYSGTEKKIRVLTECSDANLAKSQAQLISDAVKASIGV